MDIAKIAHTACAEAVRAGAEYADVSVSTGRSVTVNVEKNGIHDVREQRSAGISVRAIVKGGKAFATTSVLDEESARVVGERAANAAKEAQADPDFVSLPSPNPYTDVPNLHDQRVAALSSVDMIDLVMTEVDGARAVDDRAIVEGGSTLSDSEGVIVNSLGVEGRRASTSVNFSISSLIRVGDDVGLYYDYDSAHMMDDFAPQGLGERVCRQTQRYLGGRSCETAVLPVVAGPMAARSFISGLVSAADAEDIQRGRSYLIGKRGERIGPEFLTIVDDPHIPGGLSSGAFDSEGAPAQRVAVIQNGVVANWLHGSYTANIAGEPNNGHGTRRGGVSATNIIPSLGELTAEQIIKETGEGIYIERGMLGPSLTSGELSATVDFGFKIENGELAYPLKNTMIGIGVWDMLDCLDAVSCDYREEPGMIMPTIRFGAVRVAGGD
jgi:PmbA protein